MTDFVLLRPESAVGWELRGALASGRSVRLALSDRCDGVLRNGDGQRILEGRVQRVAATNAYCVVQGRHIPLSDVLAVARPHFTQAKASDPTDPMDRPPQREETLAYRELADRLRELDPEMAPSNTRVSIWERGDEKPSDRYMRSLVRVLDKSTDWFYTDHQEAQETPDLLAKTPEANEPAWVSRLEKTLDQVLAAVDVDPMDLALAAIDDIVAAATEGSDSQPPTVVDLEQIRAAIRARKRA